MVIVMRPDCAKEDIARVESKLRAMGLHVITAHATGRILRQAITQALTTQAVEAVTWPA